MAYICPPGLDCASQNACPAPKADCPVGYFCSPYNESVTSTVTIEVLDATYKRYYAGTNDPVPPPAYSLQSQCFPGFECANGTSMLQCAAGSYCPQGTLKALSCDGLSICGIGSSFQINFVVPVICAILSLIIGVASCVLIGRQQRAAAKSRAVQASASAAATPNAASPLDSARALTGGASLRSPHSGPPTPIAGEGSLHFEMRGANVTAANGRVLLRDCSVAYPPGQLCAVLGPSGSGKSILLDVLRGRPPGEVTGSLTVNGHPLSDASTLAALRPLLGFVTKEDVVDRGLTAREQLVLSAQQHLPASTTVGAVEGTVGATMHALKLTGVADVVVGGGANSAANISGGQLKRVSVGVELVGEPRALILDEPTSGLDASSSLELMRAVKAVADRGVTVVTVLHQPRPEVWALLDRVTVLVEGGRVIYDGPRDGIVAYFESLGSTSLAPLGAKQGKFNPADWVVDLSSGLLDSPGSSGSSSGGKGAAVSSASTAAIDELARQWTERSAAAAAAGSSGGARDGDGARSPLPTPLPRPGFFIQVWLEMRRTLLLRLRDRGSLALQGFLQCFLALALSSAFSPLVQSGGYFGILQPPIPSALQNYCPPFLREACGKNVQDPGLRQLGFFTTVSSGTASAIAGVGLFGGVAPLLRRQVDSGLNPVAFALGRMLTDLIFVAWNASCFSALWMLFAPSGSWYNWLAIHAGLTFVAFGFGYFVASFMRPVNAAMVVMVSCLTFSVFSGIVPKLKDVVVYPIVNWAWLLSFATWVAEAVYFTFSYYWRDIRDVQAGADGFGFSSASIGPAIGKMFGLGLMWRAVAMYILAAKATGRYVPASVESAARGLFAAVGGLCSASHRRVDRVPLRSSAAPSTSTPSGLGAHGGGSRGGNAVAI